MRACIAATGFVAGLFLWSAGVDAQGTAKAMTVFVTAEEVVDVTKVDKETQKRLEAAIRDAEKKRKDLEKTLKAQHGNKRENWPPLLLEDFIAKNSDAMMATGTNR